MIERAISRESINALPARPSALARLIVQLPFRPSAHDYLATGGILAHRKLAIALWRFVELGLVPEGAIINRRVIANEAKRLRRSFGLRWAGGMCDCRRIADLVMPICRIKDGSRPSRAIVHACSKVANNEAPEVR
jgi:hypothetical protein